MRLLAVLLILVLSMNAHSEENFYPRGPWLVGMDEMFTCKSANGTTFEFDPKTIQKIKVITNDKGPFEEDVFWKFEYTGGECYFPSSGDKDGSFLAHFQGLRGFDNKALIQAASSANNAAFLVWDRNAL